MCEKSIGIRAPHVWQKNIVRNKFHTGHRDVHTVVSLISHSLAVQPYLP